MVRKDPVRATTLSRHSRRRVGRWAPMPFPANVLRRRPAAAPSPFTSPPRASGPSARPTDSTERPAPAAYRKPSPAAAGRLLGKVKEEAARGRGTFAPGAYRLLRGPHARDRLDRRRQPIQTAPARPTTRVASCSRCHGACRTTLPKWEKNQKKARSCDRAFIHSARAVLTSACPRRGSSWCRPSPFPGNRSSWRSGRSAATTQWRCRCRQPWA